MAKAEVSPKEPATEPKNKSGRLLRAAPMTKGVAVVTASKGAVQVVMAAAKEAVRNALPTSAGLNGLCPNPPKTCFPMPMANADPIITIQLGKLGGTHSAKSTPVNNALPSPIWMGIFLIY